MLMSFLPIKDEHGKKIVPFALDCASTVRNKIGNAATRLWMSSYVPMIFANAPNLAERCEGLAVDCKGLYKLEVKDLNLTLVYIDLADRYGYLGLYESQTEKLLYLCYCGEITLTLSIKSMFVDAPSGSGGMKNVCMVAPIDSVITSEEPYKSEWEGMKVAFMLSSHSYVYMDGYILKCKRIGRQGRDLQVVDKFYVTNKIPELNKALSHEPTCLINCKQMLAGFGSDNNTRRILSERLLGQRLPIARMGMKTALSDTENDADIIAALALTPVNEAICATLSNDWLKRAVKHKLNKFPPEITSDGKYEVQRLTTEATIKYQGDSWKGAEKSDLIYVIVEKVSRKPVSIISIGKSELDDIKLRRATVKSTLSTHTPAIQHITLEFDSYAIDKVLITGFIDEDSSNMSNFAIMRKFVVEYEGGSIPWRDFFNHEAVHSEKCAKALKTYTGNLISHLNVLSSASKNTFDFYMHTTEHKNDTFGRLTRSAEEPDTIHVYKLSRECKEMQPREFNFPTVTIIVPDKNGEKQTFEGKVKFGVALMKNVNNPDDNFMFYVERLHNLGVGRSAYGSLSLCDYIFPTYPLHEHAVLNKECELGYQLIVSHAIYGKKFKDLYKLLGFHPAQNAERCLAIIARLTSTGINYEQNPFVSSLCLGYIPDTYEEYKELIKFDETFASMEDRNKTVLYTQNSLNYDDESLLDAMEEDDDYSDLLEEDEELEDDYDADGFDEADDVSEDNDELLDDMDNFEDEDDTDDEWATQRLLWLQRHPDSKYITDNGKEVYWFDIMHIMMKQDQPANANNIQLLETIWNSMLSKMEGYNAHDVMAMMYEQLKEDTTDDGGQEDSTASANTLTDDDDDLFADL